MEATLNAPQVTAPAKAKRVHVKTPGSMVPKSTDAAVSSPKVIDLVALVAQVAKAKAAIGSKFMGHKGKQSLFALVCNAVRSLRGDAKFNKDGSVRHLPEELATDIRKAVNAFWLTQATKMVTEYGEVVSVQWDSPKAKVFDAEGGLKDVGLTWNATLKARRDSKDDAEFRLGLSFEIGKATKRLAFMQDNPNKYDRTEVRAQQDLLTILESKQLAMNKAKEAIEELEKRRVAGTVTPDEYQAELKKLQVVKS